jgi:hypothetical protein
MLGEMVLWQSTQEAAANPIPGIIPIAVKHKIGTQNKLDLFIVMRPFGSVHLSILESFIPENCIIKYQRIS